MIWTDEVLLGRVIGNLIKNALEASASGQTVTVAFENKRQPLFAIHNPSVMPEAVQLQMFQRSFSTRRGRGRGIGSYSVKLLTEKYLKGKVWFVSRETEGTTFFVALPSPSGRGCVPCVRLWTVATRTIGKTNAISRDLKRSKRPSNQGASHCRVEDQRVKN